jgi:serine protease inhibitor
MFYFDDIRIGNDAKLLSVEQPFKVDDLSLFIFNGHISGIQ